MKILSRPSLIPQFPSTDSVAGRSYPRKELSQILLSYNQKIGNDEAALQNARKLADAESVCVLTGQQLGLLGGPIYTILKGISCLIEARKRNAIPIFWLATEDHDIGEIDHAYLIDNLGNLKKYHLSFPKNGKFVEDLVLTESHIAEIKRFFEHLYLEIPVPFKVGDLYAESMARLLADLFKGTGLLFIEPHLLRAHAIPIIEKELRHAHAILEKVNAAFDFTEGTNIFLKNEQGKRCKVFQDATGYHADGSYFNLEKVHETPERFSTNVAARPIVQSFLFPTVAYVAGPNEIQYYQKLAELHHFHDIPMPTLIPRMQATFIPRQIADFLEKIGMQPWENIPSYRASAHDLPTDAMHRIHNTLHPRNKPQERILSWWQFQAETKESLITSILNHTHQESAEHLYIYL